MSDYNETQYRLMLAQILEFERGELSFNSLVVDLQDPFRNLYGEEESWRQSFMEHWREMEQVKSTVVFRGTKRLTAEESVIITRAVAAIKSMVVGRIEDPMMDPNSPIA
jgi:hypothetical protein